MILFGCRRDSQSRKTNRWRKCDAFASHRPLAHFWTDIRFGNFLACRSGVYFVFQKQWKTTRFRRPGPARNRCVSGLGRDVFFGGRSRERSVLNRFCSESTKKRSTFSKRSQIDVRRPPTVTFLATACHAVFNTCVRTGRPKRVAKIVLKQVCGARPNPNRVNGPKLCMYVMM